MTVTLAIGSLTFSSDPAVALGIDEGALDGWFSSPPVKTQPDDRANGDGSFGITKFLRSARPLTLPGFYGGSGDAVADAIMARRLSGLLASGAPGTITVTDPAGPLTAQVTLIGDGVVVSPQVGGAISYTISMLAFDPVKYGVATNPSTGLPTSGGGLEYPLESGGAGGALYYGANGNLGRLTLVNNGTADYWPKFLVPGQFDTGFYIQCLDTGQVLQYARVVPIGTTVSIDSRTGEVLIDGVSDASTYLVRDDFFAVPAGGSIQVQLNPLTTSSGSPAWSASQADGWW